jgi:hypothetical protein
VVDMHFAAVNLKRNPNARVTISDTITIARFNFPHGKIKDSVYMLKYTRYKFPYLHLRARVPGDAATFFFCEGCFEMITQYASRIFIFNFRGTF